MPRFGGFAERMLFFAELQCNNAREVPGLKKTALVSMVSVPTHCVVALCG